MQNQFYISKTYDKLIASIQKKFNNSNANPVVIQDILSFSFSTYNSGKNVTFIPTVLLILLPQLYERRSTNSFIISVQENKKIRYIEPNLKYVCNVFLLYTVYSQTVTGWFSCMPKFFLSLVALLYFLYIFASIVEYLLTYWSFDFVDNKFSHYH